MQQRENVIGSWDWVSWYCLGRLELQHPNTKITLLDESGKAICGVIPYEYTETLVFERIPYSERIAS